MKADVVYVLNKNEGVIAVFDKKNKDTLINPEISETQNSDNILTFQVDAKSKKWNETYNPENLYLVENKIFSANFSDSYSRNRTEEDEDLITIVAYERQKLLTREYVRAWNSTTGFENIDEFMVVILSNGNLDLKNNDIAVVPKYPKGSSGYALEGILYGTGWTVGTCDIYEYNNGEIVTDTNGKPVYQKFDLETDQEDVYSNIQTIQELWGGILIFDSVNKIVHHRDETTYLPYSGFEVKYKKNLETSEYIGDNKIITKLCPLGEGSLNIKSVNNNDLWLTNFSYTDTVLKAIENNPNIYDPQQLKKWGERKLKELCKPRKELTVEAALLKRVKGFEHETIALNDIVDVIDYDYIENKTEQLRVLSYRRKIWSDEGVELVLGDITLESTDIFKKNVGATNLINNGTLDTSKIVDYYKNGQSLKETLRQVDQTIIDTKSELSKADDVIKASISQVITEVDNLNNDIVSQDEKISQLIIDIEGIESKVSTIADVTKTITGENGKIILEKAVKGALMGLSIRGYEGSFRGIFLGDDTILSDDLILSDHGILEFKTYTKNLCPTIPTEWINGYYDTENKLAINESTTSIITKNYTRIEPERDVVLSIKNNDQEYGIRNIIFFDVYKNYLGTGENVNYNLERTTYELTTPQDAYYFKVELYNMKNEEFSILTVQDLEVQLEYGTERTEYVAYNYKEYTFDLQDELRVLDDKTFDEFTVLNNEAFLIRRIGEDSEGNLYKLTNEAITSYGPLTIPVVDGDNIIEVIGNTPTIIVKYAVQNDFTDLFASKVEVSTMIRQTDEQILLLASKSVYSDELIQTFNSQLSISPEIIIVEGNKIRIKSSYFELTEDGQIIAKKGTIAGWIIESDRLYKNRSGLRSGTADDDVVFYAGANNGTINNPKFQVRNNGLVKAENIEFNSQSGTCTINYDSGNKSIEFFEDGLNFCLDDQKNTLYSTLYKVGPAYGMFMSLYGAKHFGFVDMLHPLYQEILYIIRLEPNDNQERELRTFADIKVKGNRVLDGINHSIYIQGYEVATNPSDERLKENIIECEGNALNIINEIPIITFDWKKDTHRRDAGQHIPFGYGAQRTQKVYDKAVIYNKENDTYQMDTLNLSALQSKAIQELSAKVNSLEQELKEIKEMLKNKEG